jgi:hypothetical protein
MIVRVVICFVTALFIGGCGSGVRFVRMDSTKYPARDKDAAVETFPKGTMEPHVVIGTLSTQKKMHASFDDRSVYDQVLAELKSYARRIGADALIDVQPHYVGEGMNGRVQMDATAVRYLKQSETISSADPEKKDTP